MNTLRRFTDFILNNSYQTAGMVVAFAFIPLIGGSISMLIAGFVTLRKGIFEGCLITMAATLPILAMYFWSDATPNQGYYALIAVNLVILGNFSVWLFAAMLRKYNNWGLLLEFAILLGLAIILILHLLYPNIQVWWLGQLESYIGKTKATVGGFQANNSGPVLDDLQMQFIKMLSYYTTGLFIAYTFFSVLMQVGMARWWQSVLYNPGGLRQELYQIRLSHVSGTLFIVAFIISNFGNETVLDMMPVLYVIFSLAGLSLLHCIVAPREGGIFWLVLIYAFLTGAFIVRIDLLPVSIALLTFIALLDIWMDLRNRFLFKR